MRKPTIKIGTATLVAAMMIGNSSFVFAEDGDTQSKPLKISIMSDTHYFSEVLYGDNEDFTTVLNSDRKMLQESSAIFDSSLKKIVEDEPDIVMISGDLTKDGEEVNHRSVAKGLKQAKDQLQKKGKHTQFYVINGNHDINNPDAKDYSSGKETDADRTTPEEFREIYHDFGYGDNTEKYAPNSDRGGSLSYVAHPADGYTLIAVDDCKYSSDQTTSGKDLQETGGVINDDLMNWVKKEASEAKADGDVVMVLEHHGILPHFTEEPTVMGDYLVDNYETAKDDYIDNGVDYVFTGHMHANDIAAYKKGDKTLYDMETGSLVTYPSLYREVIVQKGTENTVDGNTLTSTMRSPNPVDYKEFGSEEHVNIEDLTSYAQEHTQLNSTVVSTMLTDGILKPGIQSLQETGGVKGLVASLLSGMISAEVAPEEVGDHAAILISGMLPKTKEEGLKVSLANMNFVIYTKPSPTADQKAGEIRIEQTNEKVLSDQEEGVVMIPMEDGTNVEVILPEELQNAVRTAVQDTEGSTYGIGDLLDPTIAFKINIGKLGVFINSVLDAVDHDILGDPTKINKVVDEIITTLMDDTKVDDIHTVADVVTTVYQTHLAGNEEREPWLEEAINNIRTTSLLTDAVRKAVNAGVACMATKEVFGDVSVPLNGVIEAGNSSIITGTAVGLIGGFNTVGKLIGLVKDPGSLIPDSVLSPVNDLAYKVADSMTSDDTQDLDLTIVNAGRQPRPEKKPASVEDIQALQDLIVSCEDLLGGSDKYAPEMVDVLREVVAQAKSVIAKGDVTEAEITEMLNRLNKVKEDVLNSTYTDSEEPDTSGDKAEAQKPHTGVHDDPITYASIMIAALTGAYIICKKH